LKALLSMLAVVVLVATSCGSTSQLTEDHMQQMSDADAASLLECQMEKVIAEKGQEAGVEYVADLVEKAVKEDGPTVQVTLWKEGYTCDEWGDGWHIE
jgi:maltose-binding protein MalE